MTEGVMSVAETCTFLGMSRSAVHQAMKRGEIPSVKIGKRRLIPRATLERLIAGETAVPQRQEVAHVGRSA